MKKREKGFTLIELLVVVAIIGTLAAVGVVAYNGYTAAAKKNSSKAIHANAVKYVASELAKCNMDDSSEIFGGAGSVNCDSTAEDIVTMLTGSSTPMSDKNPYSTSNNAVSAGTTTTTTDADGKETVETTCEEGYTCMSADGSTITIATTYDADESALSNEVEVE